MIEVPTKGKQALLDAFIHYVDPDTYQAYDAGACLVGQTAGALGVGFWDSRIEFLSERFGVDVDLIDTIYGGVMDLEQYDDKDEAIDYARRVLGLEES